MKKYFLLMTTFCMLFSGCISHKNIDYDRAAVARFGDYLCFSVESRETRYDFQDLLLSPIVDRRIEKAIKLTLLDKGFSDSCSEIDFRVSFGTVSKTRTRAINVGVSTSPFWRQSHLRLGGYSRVDLEQYEEGTFVIDIIDHLTNQLVWRGSYTKSLSRNAPTGDEISTIVEEILETFPPISE